VAKNTNCLVLNHNHFRPYLDSNVAFQSNWTQLSDSSSL